MFCFTPDSLGDYLLQHNIVGIQGVDTRALTKLLRSQGTMNGMITCAEHFHVQEVMDKLASPMAPIASPRNTAPLDKIKVAFKLASHLIFYSVYFTDLPPKKQENLPRFFTVPMKIGVLDKPGAYPHHDGDEPRQQGDAVVLHGDGGQIGDDEGEHQLGGLQLPNLVLTQQAYAHDNEQV